MRLLFVTSEIFPLIKTGGLADVSGALPIALSQSGIDVQIILPAYRGIMQQCKTVHYLGELAVFHNLKCDIYKASLPGTNIPLLLIDYPELYDREGGPYHHPQHGDWQDNPLRFGVLSKVAAMMAKPNILQDWHADIVHCNDWQTGLTPYYLRQANQKIKSVFSIHNLAFQGNFHPDWRYKLELDDRDFQPEGYEYFGHLSFMKAGLYYATLLTTVSPTYAKEVQTKECGFGFEGLLQHRSAELTGILNGIDTEVWNPDTDPYLCAHYNSQKLSPKKKIKHALQEELGLDSNPHSPLLGVVSRLTYQKGLDMLLAVADELLQSTSCQLAILGSGELDLELQYKLLMQRYPGRVSTTIGYNEPLSHRIMAGTDIFVMPSRFEPCGLNQMYGLRYGTIPLVANTGGLADSVTGMEFPFDKSISRVATGFVMPENNIETLLVTLRAAITTYANYGHWKQLQKQAMQQDVSWETSARHYLSLYNQLILS